MNESTAERCLVPTWRASLAVGCQIWWLCRQIPLFQSEKWSAVPITFATLEFLQESHE